MVAENGFDEMAMDLQPIMCRVLFLAGCLLPGLLPIELAWSQESAIQPAVERPSRPRAARRAEEPLPADTPVTTDGGRTINPALLERVVDSSNGIQEEDRPAYFYILWLCRQIELPDLRNLAKEYRRERMSVDPRFAVLPSSAFPIFSDVFRNPDDYRGRPVTIRGQLRKLVKFDPGPNDFGFRHAYEGWLYTDDSQGKPAVVIFTKKPKDLPIGGDIAEEVRFSGYFLKLYHYPAQDVQRSAPLILGGEIVWLPSDPVEATADAPRWAYVATMLAMLAGVVVVIRSHSPLAIRPPDTVVFDASGRVIEHWTLTERYAGTDANPVLDANGEYHH